MELCTNGNLQDYIKSSKKVNQNIAKYVTASIINGLEHMQDSGIIHRDLKPWNILLDKNHDVKIADFGTAKILNWSDEKVLKAIRKRNKRDESRSISPAKKNSFVGTNLYISPEVLKGHEPSPAIDLWSLGIILYQIYTKKTPFFGENEMMMYQSILEGNLVRHPAIPDDAWKLIKSLLNVDPMKRLGYNPETHTIDYSKIRSCEFLKDIDFKDLSYKKALNLRETSVSFGDCSTKIDENDRDKSPENGEASRKANKPLDSFAVPIIDEEDDEDYFTDNFTNASKKTTFIAVDNTGYEDGGLWKFKSRSNIIEYVKEDYFNEENRKYSLKCDDCKGFDVPLLFDEESNDSISSYFRSEFSLNLLKAKSCAQ